MHVVLDNLSTHKTPKIQRWLLRHKRFHFHFTPTYGSWMNLVERWFRDITGKAIRRRVFGSVPHLTSAIEAYLEPNNDQPEPLVWTATAQSILDKVRRGRKTLESITG